MKPRRAPALVLAVLLSAVTPVVGAQDVDGARTQREENRAEQARVARELDVSTAEVAQIRAALDGLDQSLALQQARIDAAAQNLAAATRTAEAQQRIVVETGERIAELRSRVESSIVDAYTGGVGAPTEGWVGAADLSEATQKRELLQVVRGRFADDLDVLRGLVETQRRAAEAAEAAVADAGRAREALEAERQELQVQRDTEARLEDGLRSKVVDYEAKAQQLRSAEQELTDIITAHQAAAAASASAAATASSSSGSGSSSDSSGSASGAGSDTGRSSSPSLSGASSSGFILPADGPVTSPFGYRRHPILGTVRLHAGTDIGAPYGAPIWASKGGEVIFAGWNGGYGNCVIIAHGGGISTLYGHQSELNVSEGQTVSQGDVIGWVGSTGQSTGAHLHFEVRVGGSTEDPELYL